MNTDQDAVRILSGRRRGISATQLLALAAMTGVTAGLPAVSPDFLGTALRRGRRHRPMVIDTKAHRIENAEIAAWNAEVDRKKAEKLRAKGKL